MNRTLSLLASALLLSACAPEPGSLEAPDDAALLLDFGGTLAMFEICRDGKDNDKDGEIDEQPCKNLSGPGGGFIGGAEDGLGIMGNPEELTVPWDDVGTYTVSANRDGDLEFTVDKDLVGVIFLPEGTRQAHLAYTSDENERTQGLGLVLDKDVNEAFAGAFEIRSVDGYWEATFEGGKR